VLPAATDADKNSQKSALYSFYVVARSQKNDAGWLRLVGSFKLQVSFAKEPYKKDDILQKRPIILRSLLLVATPYPKWSSEWSSES